MPFDLASAQPVESGGFDLASAQPVGQAPDNSASARITAPFAGANKGIANTLGLPMDALANVLDLGKAGLGTAFGALRKGSEEGGPGAIPKSLEINADRSELPLSGQWFEKWLNKVGVETNPRNPSDPMQRYGSAIGQVLPAAAAGAAGSGASLGQTAMAAGRAALGGVASQGVADAGGGPSAQIAAGLLGNKTGISDLARAGTAKALAAIEAKAAPRVQQDLANAQSVNPNGQTVAQSTASPFLAKIGQGAAGSTTAESSAQIVDKLTSGLLKQAKDIAPLGISHPEVAENVAKSVASKDSDLANRADAVYESGRKAATSKGAGENVTTDNTVQAVDEMLAMAKDPRNLAPPAVTKRLQGLIDTLRPVKAPQPGMEALGGTPATTPGGTSWGGFYDLRKQINTLFDEVPSESITPSMNATFSKLKQGYYADLSNAPEGPAKQITHKANEIYSGIQDQREVLKNSVVSQILGKDAKVAISDPDQVLNRLVGMPPAAQAYARGILEQYSPDALDKLRSYAITKNVKDAARTGAPATVSQTNAKALTPGSLADSGLFTPEQVTELKARESALRTALTALPEKGAPTAEVTPQSAGRLLGGGLSPTFLGGTMANVLSAGKLERALNTPEGRNSILKPTDSKSAKVQRAVATWQAALAAQIADDRADAKAGPNGP